MVNYRKLPQIVVFIAMISFLASCARVLPGQVQAKPPEKYKTSEELAREKAASYCAQQGYKRVEEVNMASTVSDIDTSQIFCGTVRTSCPLGLKQRQKRECLEYQCYKYGRERRSRLSFKCRA
jgi:putative hemolysin